MKPFQTVVQAGVAALVFFSGAVCAGLFSDPDPNWKEGHYELPAPPLPSALHEFPVDVTSRNRFLLDEHSLTVGEDGVVRYVLVVRTAGGAENVTFEGIHCEVAGWRIYAVGRDGGEWAVARDAGWQPIVDTAYNRPRAALAKEYFCDGVVPPRDAREVLRRLRGREPALK
ncbi:CNP1-like family protein [Azoarcus sp. PA01]|nr:CNP1-like family protein [Azoarcus sp. PA01]